MMKRTSRFLSLLVVLCLMAGILAVPAGAAQVELFASLSDLQAEAAAKKQEWDSAKADVTKAEADLETAKSGVASAEKALEDAEGNLEAAKQDRAEASAQVTECEEALKNLSKDDPEDKDDPGDNASADDKAAAAQALADAKKSLADAEAALNSAEEAKTNAEAALQAAKDSSSAQITAAEEALKAAEAKAEQAKQAYETANQAAKDAADAAAGQTKPNKPSGSDLSYPSSVNFGTLEKGTKGSSLSKEFTIRNRSDYDMVLSASSARGFTISGVPGTLSAGSSATVTVKLNSADSTGTYSRTLTISAAFAHGGDSYTMSIDLYAEVAEKGYSLSVDPTSKDLGKLKEGYEEKAAKDKEVTVILENKGASDLRLDGVKGAEHFTVTAAKSSTDWLYAGDEAKFTIVPKQDLKTGTYTDTITFQTREGATAQFKATIVIEKKVDPLTLEPATLDFGAVEEGYAALTPKTVTIKNNTDYAVRLEQPTSFSYEISLLGQTALSAGSSATFTIRPRSGLPANSYNGAVEIYGTTSDTTHSARLTVNFTVNRPAGPSTFTDVAAGSTFAADIAYVSQQGLMGGVGNGNFNPQSPITRGQLVTILYRLDGQPAVSGTGFIDVADGSYCEKAVKWAAANRITNGNEDGTFKPNDPISRQQLATFLYRYNNYKGYMVAKQADLGTFSDGSSVASYAKDALSWANGVGLVNGTSDNRLNPSGGATRGQAAAILHRFCVSIGK